MPIDPKAIAIIPARWDSSRFPGKPLEKIRGRSMIEWVVERTLKAQRVEEVIVATDDKRIFEVVVSFGGKVVMTSRDHPSGIDRIAEATHSLNYSIVVNVQGDEPIIPPENIDLVVEPFLKDNKLKVSTLKIQLKKTWDVLNPNITKVVTNKDGFALYFSRAPIPYNREGWGSLFAQGNEKKMNLRSIGVYKHIGIYGLSKSFLMEFSKIPRSYLEECEQLEQLRILNYGVPIRVMETQRDSIGVDCPEDLVKVEQFLSESEI